MKLFDKTGPMALGSRLRLLSSKMTEEASEIYQLYGSDFSPKWFPVFFSLNSEGPQTITDIADYIGHSQPSVTKIIKEMIAAGLCKNIKSADKRRNTVGLTANGKKLGDAFLLQYKDVDAAVNTLMEEARYNLWEAVAEWEFLLEKKSLLARVQEQKRLRESKDVWIVDYEDKYQTAFKALNEEWITTYFEMEDADYKALDHPKEYIINKGGKIFIALYKGEPLGACSLIKINGTTYELAKMAVSPKAQGRHIGLLLGQAVIKAAKELKATKICLDSNTKLKPAIKLYEKLGFRQVPGFASPYKRVNIQMELELS